LLDYNSEYLEVRDQRENMLANVSMMEALKFQKGKQYHFVYPNAEESNLVCSLI